MRKVNVKKSKMKGTGYVCSDHLRPDLYKGLL